MERRQPPDTAAGHYVLHDFRRIDWDAWDSHSETAQAEVLEEIEGLLADGAAVEEGDLGCYSVLGHKADLLILVLRPTMAELDQFERAFDRTAFASLTERTTSALGVTEASGYTEAASAFFDEEAEADAGIARYMETRLYPDVPDAEFASFYFMNKRRHPDANWYDLPYDERADHVARHGEIGKEYAGEVTQMITGSMGFDDWEWGVTLFANDMVAIKDLLMDMRFDPSTSQFAEFGQFYAARRFPPSDLAAFLAGESIPTEERTASADAEVVDALEHLDVDPAVAGEAHAVIVYSGTSREVLEAEVDGLRSNFEHYDSHVSTTVTATDDGSATVSLWETERAADTAAGFLEELPDVTNSLTGQLGDLESDETTEEIRSTLEAEGIYAGVPHGEEIHALVLYAESDLETLTEATKDLSDGFDRYDTHEGTAVYESTTGDRHAVVSLWETEDAAETAAEYLQDLPGIITRAGSGEGFATMGMFYQVKPEHAEAFRDTFGEVRQALRAMDGHRETDLLANVADRNDMFIASHWREKDDAMAFFRSEDFRETVEWGRDILADRPRHVFLA